MIVITGAAGFIGSSMVQHLNESGRSDLVLVDDFPVMPVEPGYDVPKIASSPDVETFHETSLQTMRYIEKVPRDLFFDWLALNRQKVDLSFIWLQKSIPCQMILPAFMNTSWNFRNACGVLQL